MFSQNKVASVRKASTILHVWLDLDKTLVNGLPGIDKIEQAVKYYPFLSFAAKQNLMIDACFIHLIHPGAIELLQYLFRVAKVKVSFFSSGEESRNTPLVKALLTRALGALEYQDIKGQVKIYSRYHRVKVDTSAPNNQLLLKQAALLGGDISFIKKDLLYCDPSLSLSNAILIDDDAGIIALGQEKNWLKTPGADLNDFQDLHEHENHMKFLSDTRLVAALYKVNHIYYVAGLVQWLLSQDAPVPEALYTLQFDKVEVGTIKPHQIHKRPDVYCEGLKLLQQFNPSLAFHGGAEAQLLLNNNVKNNTSQLR